MSLTLDQVYDLLASHQPVVLTPGLFQGTTEALASLGAAALTISKSGAPVKAAGEVTLDGTADEVCGVKGVAAHLEVIGDGDALAVALTFTLPASWQFTVSFPKLPQSYKAVDDTPGLSSLQPSVLGDLHFRNPTLIVQSAATTARPAGLSFTGDLTDTTAFKNLVAPLGLGPTPAVTGTIALKGRDVAPDVALRVATGIPTLNVGSWLQLGDVALGVTTAPSPQDDATPVTLIEVTATVTVGAVPVHIKSPILGLSKLFAFSAELEPGVVSIESGIEALAKLAGGTAKDYALPEGIKLLESLSLREISTVVDPTVPYVRHLQFAVDSNQTWAISENVAITGLGFGWLIQFPFETKLRQVAASLHGQLTLGKGTDAVRFDLEAHSFGGFYASGSLHEGDTIHLTRLISQALGRPADGLPEWDLTRLGLTLDTGSHELTFAATSTFTPVAGKPATLALDIRLAKVSDAYEGTIRGELIVGAQVFESELNVTGTTKTLRFTWSDRGVPFTFTDLAGFFGYTMAPLPDGLDLTLAGASFLYDFGAKSVVVSAQSKTGRQILFASTVPAQPPDSARLYLFELDVPLHFQLKDLPVIGDKLPPDLQFGIDSLQVVVASDKVPDVATLNALIAAGGGKGALIPSQLAKGLTFAAMLRAGSSTTPFVVPLSGDATEPPKRLAAAAEGDDPARAEGPDYQAAARWFAVDKTFGPVSLKRVGVQYEDSRLFFLLDASLGFSALEIELNGLGVGSALSEVELVPHLDGLSVTFESGPVRIDGALLRVPPSELPRRPPPNDVAFQYIGTVTIAVQPYLIGGIASYAKVGDRSSFFLFAQLTGEIGGSPAFFITGFMGGFGFNSALTLPAADEIAAFPFLAGLDDPSVFGKDKPGPLDVMTALAGGGGKPAWVVPTADASWIAAGIRFRSFELVDGRALLVVTLGPQFAVALYGLATLTLPQGTKNRDEAYAFVQLQIEAVFKPSEGFFGVDGSLTPSSYLLTRDCRLTGGFAFWTWFATDDPKSHEHAGDFVVSIGGYHPAFVPPKWYPALSRVGFNWPVNTETTIKGGAYMALTPTAIMAGGSLEAVYQSGNLRAWFTADANLMIRWKPFYFTAGIGISIGASYRLTLGALSTTLSVELGASLELWGPPTGGIVHVHWFILSFSVGFGADKKDAGGLQLDWNGFRTLLPTAPAKDHLRSVLGAASGDDGTKSAVLGIQLNGGLIRIDEPTGTWVVRGDELVFTTESAMPATAIALDGTAVALRDQRDQKDGGDPGATIDIRPMNLSGLTSTHTVTITKVADPPPGRVDWTPVVQRRNLPEALWGAPLGVNSPPPSAATVPNLPVGLTLTAPPAKEGRSPGVMDIAAIVTPLDGGAMPLGPVTQTGASRQPLLSANGLAPGQMQLFDDFTPGLDDGTYRIEVTQSVTAPGASIDPISRLFTVAGPRFELEPADLQAQFPPNGVSGQFDRALPQVVLARRRLPWERKIPGVDPSTPWLALLVFDSGELIDFAVEGAPVDADPTASQVIANGGRTLTVEQLLHTTGVRIPRIDLGSLSQDERQTKCQAIRISRETFAAIVPTAAEARALAHVRKVGTGTFSVVAANRFPAAGAGTVGARNVVHLVSLEGFGDLIGDTPAAPAETQVQLVSLASWTFTCLEDAAQTFAGLVETLAHDGNQARPAASLLLRVPSTGSDSPADKARLDAGYVQLPYHTRAGQDTTTWFRGPLSPVAVTLAEQRSPLMRAAEAVRPAMVEGSDDLSLATAWQIGRNLALADRAFAMALMRTRRKAGRVLARSLAGGPPSSPLANVAKLFAGGAATAILQASKSDRLEPIVRRRGSVAAVATAAGVAAQLRTLAADASFHAALADDMQDDADAAAVAQWTAQLHTLTGVPFVHLVPDARMLPPGSIRFFYVDPTWIAALADGALSLGLNTGHDVAIHAAIVGGLGRLAVSADAPTPIAGLLLRSPVVSDFPGLRISATLPGGAPLEPMRVDRLRSDVLLCLFTSVPETVTLARPHEGIDLGVDDNGQVTLRTIANGVITSGAKVTVFDPRTPAAPGNIVRPGGQRVLDVRRLIGALHQPADAGAALFTLQMLRGAEQIEFSRTTGNR